MNFSGLFIVRPVATALLMIALVLVGLVSVGFLPVSSLPDVDYPTIQVRTFYPGASPEVMSTTVTAPLEVQLGEIPGLQQMTSISSATASIITLQFDLSINLDVAEQNVQEAINAANSLLPSGLPAPPTYAKVNPADQPILTLAVTSDAMSLTQLQDVANNRLASKIAEVPGVGLVSPAGGNVPAIRVEADPQKLASYGLNMDDLRTLLSDVTLSQPKGNFDGPELDYTINDNDQISDPKDYLDTVIAYQGGSPVRLRDVATVSQAPQDIEQGAWFNDKPAIVLNVQRQPGANVIKTVDQIKRELPQLLASLPPSMHVDIVADSTGVIRSSVYDAAFELVFAIVLVVLVIFVFLRNLPATIIPSISVPVSLIGTLAVMYKLGYSIDNLSLMALIIATGFVVDDSIVMIENIVRYLEEGMRPLEAALTGAGQIGFTIISLTVSLIAVLIPLLFMGGVIGRLFSEFAVTLAITIVLSAVVSLTLVPMLCARMLRRRSERDTSRFERISEGLFNMTLSAYERGLRWVLRHQGLTLLVAIVTVALTGYLYVVIPKGLFPVQDIGVLQGISIADNAVSYQAMSARQMALADAILKDADVTSLTSYVGIDGSNATLNNGRFLINLKGVDDRSLTAEQIARRIQGEVAHIPGIKLYLQPEQDLTLNTTVSPNQYQFVLRGPSQQAFAKYVPQIIDKMRQIKSITDVDSDLNNEGLTRQCRCQPTARRTLRHHPGDDRQRALRRARSAHRHDDIQPVDAISRDPGGQARSPARPEILAVALSAEPDGGDGASAAFRHRRHQDREVPACDQPSGAVPRGDRLLQSDRACVAEHGGRRNQPGDSGGASAAVDHQQLPGRGAGFPGLAFQRGVPADRGARRRLHRAGRAVRELHSSGDDSFDAAIGRHRRVARADDGRRGP